MKSILCFGDSNTFGYRPDNGKRFSSNIRWTGLLKQLFINDEVEIIEEGLVGRTSVFEDSFRPGRKGIDYLVPLLESHSPIDLLIIMLGTNDCKTIYNASAELIGLGIEKLINRARITASRALLIYFMGWAMRFPDKSVSISSKTSDAQP